MAKPVIMLDSEQIEEEFRKAELIVSDQMKMIGMIMALIGAIALILPSIPSITQAQPDPYIEGWRIASTTSIIAVGVFFIVVGIIKRKNVEKRGKTSG